MLDSVASALLGLTLMLAIAAGGILALLALTLAMAVAVVALALQAAAGALRAVPASLASKAFYLRHDAVYTYRMRRYGGSSTPGMSRTRAAFLGLIDFLTF